MDHAPVRTEWLETVDSTNSECRRRFEAGEIGPLWIAARRQTQGRGRRGRAWEGYSGNLMTSGMYTLSASPVGAAQLSFAAALSAAEVCERALPNSDIKVKWPNDVLIEGKKVCGVLLESVAATTGSIQLIIGIGINLKSAPADVERPAVSLREYGADISPEKALEILTASFERWRMSWAMDGFAPLRDAWTARAFGMGSPCIARLEGEEVEGVFSDLAEDGSLKMRLIDGSTRLISAGDVFFPGAIG